MPQALQSAWTRLERHTVPRTASNTSQYSGSARGSQPPEGGIFLPCCFAFLVGCRRVTRKAKSTPMSRHSYRERDYAFGQVMLKLRTSIGLTQAGLAERLGESAHRSCVVLTSREK